MTPTKLTTWSPEVPILNPIRLALLVTVAALIAACAASPPADTTPPNATTEIENGTTGGSVSNGQQLFVSRSCGACHTIQGIQGAAGSVGPNLTNVASVAGQRKPGLTAEEYLRESIADPDAYVVQGYPSGVMPKLPFNDQQVDDLVAFLMTRK